EVLALRGHTQDVVAAVTWSPDGLQLASGGHDGPVRLWDVTPGYVADRTPDLLPVLERRLQADPARAADLRLRAEGDARHGRRDPAAADWELAGRSKVPAAPWFLAGWWVRGPFAADAVPDEADADLDPTHAPPLTLPSPPSEGGEGRVRGADSPAAWHW